MSEADLERRIMELEIRSEEQLADMRRLQESVAAYEDRIDLLERRIKRMQDAAENEPADMPPALEDLPPHY